MGVSTMAASIKGFLKKMIPNHFLLNYLVYVPFHLRKKKFRRSVDHPQARLSDYYFHTMIRGKGEYFKKTFCDKEYGKLLAVALHPGLKVPRTVEVLKMKSFESLAKFERHIRKYEGQRYVAKPTGGSGVVVFLKKKLSQAEISGLFNAAKKDYFYRCRENQYFGLEKKVIIEEEIPGKIPLNDYKFFCSRGKVYFCQIDFDRFTGHKRNFFSVPGFKKLNVTLRFPPRPGKIKKPVHWGKMREIAASLSNYFDFVRVDLYDNGKDVFFGEVTFSPGASCEEFSDENFSIQVMRNIKENIRGI